MSYRVSACIAVILCALLSFAQTASPTVPHTIKFTGRISNGDGTPRAGIVGVRFSLYADQEGGSAVWTELQNVQLDANGNYTALLGAQHTEGVPAELFTSNEARWLGIQVESEPELPRAMLVSVPYALKAADAETLGGLPASAFMLAPVPMMAGNISGASTGSSSTPSASQPAQLTPAPSSASGSQNYVAKFDATGTNLLNSSIFDGGNGVGIGTTSPGAQFDVELTTGSAFNALNTGLTLANSSPITNAVNTAMLMNVVDQSTATNLSLQSARLVYTRDGAATGAVSAYDSIMTAASAIYANAPFQLRALDVAGPVVASGKTLNTFYGAYFASPSGAGVVTSPYALVTEPGAGSVG
ncbi:MAG: hypothetical protein ACRD3E_07320, partial [Terriglobales bacterium]